MYQKLNIKLHIYIKNIFKTLIRIHYISHNYRTIFKTYETDLDNLIIKLGFSKRSFDEWGAQVNQSFINAEKGFKGLKEAWI